MLYRVLGTLLFCASFWAPALCISQTQPLTITLGNGAVPLDGPWEFHTGDNLAWASPEFDDSQWEHLDGTRPWGEQGHANYTGFAWYRRPLSLTSAPGAPQDFALLIPHIDNAYEIYWNGQLIGSYGKRPPHPVWYLNTAAQTFNVGPVGKGVLAIRVWKAFLSSRDTGLTGGFAEPPIAGSPQSIATRKAALDGAWIRGKALSAALYSLYGLAALLGLIAWLRDRSQWLLLWAVGYLGAAFCEVVLYDWHFLWPAHFAVGLQQVVDAIGNISLWFLLCWLLDLRDNHKLMRLTRIAAIVLLTAGTLDALLTVFTWPSTHEVPSQIADAIVTAVIIPLELYSLVPIIVAIRRKQKVDHSRWLLAAAVSFAQITYCFWTATAQGNRYTHWMISQKLQVSLIHIRGSVLDLLNITDALTLITLVYAIYRYSIEMSQRRSALEQEFKNARELQQVLIPESLPKVPGFTLTSAYLPALEVGGDFFQIIPLDSGATLIILGDVSGKGLKAAMAVSLIVGAVRTLAEITASPAEITAGLNRRLHGRLQGGFATCLALHLDAAGNCTLASAGHPSPFLNGRELLVAGAFPLGLMPDTAYDETLFTLNVTDHLVLYTDGLLEARSRTGELYGFDRLHTLFATRPTAFQASEQALAFGQDDDITVLTITRHAVGEKSTTQFITPGLTASAV